MQKNYKIPTDGKRDILCSICVNSKHIVDIIIYVKLTVDQGYAEKPVHLI
jgi:hypothetical protein